MSVVDYSNTKFVLNPYITDTLQELHNKLRTDLLETGRNVFWREEKPFGFKHNISHSEAVDHIPHLK